MNPEIEELENILDAILEAVEELLQSGEEIPPDIQDQIADEILYLNSEIERLQSEEQPPPVEEIIQEESQITGITEGSPSQPPTPPTGGEVPPLDRAPHPSSNINAFRYNPENQHLFVKFQGKYPQENGPVYSYSGVPKYIFDIFARGAVGPKTSGKNRWHTWKKGITPSHGAAMAALVKAGGFAYQRLR